MTLTRQALDNADLDVQHIDKLATSEELTATDRKGQTKRTWKGIETEIDGAAATQRAVIDLTAASQLAEIAGRADEQHAEAAAQIEQIGATAAAQMESIQEAAEQQHADGEAQLTAQQVAADAQRAQIQAEADAVVNGLGYLPPVAYAAGLLMLTTRQTVAYAGQTYAPLQDQIPFTTSGTFETTKFRLIQGVTATDLAASTGAAMIGLAQGGTIKDAIQFITPETFGATGGANDTTAITNFLTACGNGRPGRWTDGKTYNIDPITLTMTGAVVDIRGNATLKNRLGASAGGALLRINGNATNRLHWEGVFFDCNGGAYHGMYVHNWAEADVNIEGAANITCTTSSPADTSGLMVNSVARSRSGWRLMRSLSAGTSTQGSIPRSITVQSSTGVECHADIEAGQVTAGHGGLVVGNMGTSGLGTVVLRSAHWDSLLDNGVYNVGNAAQVIVVDPFFDGIEEPIVNYGQGDLLVFGGSITNFSNANSVANAGLTGFYGTRIKSSGGNIIKTRSANVSSKKIEFVGCSIYGKTLFGLCDFGTGELEEFAEYGNDWTYEHSDGASTTIVRWTTGKRFVSDSRWTLKDGMTPVGGVSPMTGEFLFQVPTMSKPSRFDGFLINDTGLSAVAWRMNSVRQQWMSARHLWQDPNFGRESEINRGGPTVAEPRVVYGSAPPTTGYWPLGSICININAARGDTTANAAAGIEYWRCVVGGVTSPSAWEPVWRTLSVVQTGVDLPSIAAGATGAGVDVTVTGAQRGDVFVGAALTAYVPGLVFDGAVVAANTVRVYPRNVTGSAIDPASTSLVVRVQKVG